MSALERLGSDENNQAQARAWFARLLDDDVSFQELADWESWLDADPQNRAAYGDVCNAWRLAGPAAPSRPSEAELARDPYKGSTSVRRWRATKRPELRRVLPLLFILVILGASGGASLLSRREAAAPQELSTAKAQQLKASLPDGSKVHLAAMSTVKVLYTAARRGIEVERGQALFNVAKNPKRRFVVETPIAAMTAVGTTFDVNVLERSVLLSVSEGVVRVDAGRSNPSGLNGGSMMVHAGQQLRMQKAGTRIVAVQTESLSPPTWPEGRLEYRGEPLRFVVEEVNRYAPRTIVIADAALENLTYTGTVRLDSTEAWVRGLTEAFPIEALINKSQQIVLRNKSSSCRDLANRQRNCA